MRLVRFAAFFPPVVGLMLLLSYGYITSGGQYLFPYQVKIYCQIAFYAVIAALGVYFVIRLFSFAAREIEDMSSFTSGMNASMRFEINGRFGKKVELDAKTGEIIAYRYFYVDKRTAIPYSINSIKPHNPITERPRGSFAGGWNISDRVPTWKNQSGIYAAKTPHSHVLDGYRLTKAEMEAGLDTTHTEFNMFLAKVSLSGRVLEGKYGYRAQICNIIEFLE